MAKIDATTARQRFSEVTNRVAFGKERLVIERQGKRMVAVIPIEDLDLLERLEDLYDLRAARTALKERGTTAWSSFKAKRGL